MLKTVSTQTKAARLMRAAVLGCFIFGQLLTPAWAAALAPSLTKAPPAPTALSGPIYPSNQSLVQVNPAQAAIELIANMAHMIPAKQANQASQKPAGPAI